MLLGINPLLGGELLKMLDEMGHGDVLLVVDRNYPAASTGRPVVRVGPASTEEVVSAILGVFPLDSFVDRPLARMEARDDPAVVTKAQAAVLKLARAQAGTSLEYEVVPRLEFYRRALDSYGVVQSLDARAYGCFLLRKGVVTD
jgi:L-fucose mutarotase